MQSLALDIGGSSIKRALVKVDDHGDARIVDRFDNVILPSNRFVDLKEHVLSSIDDLWRQKVPISNVAISTAGAVDARGLVISAGNFTGYRNINWREILTKTFEAVDTVHTVNDGKAGTWAEYVAQGQGSEVFVHFVVGTGVGGGIVCFGHLVHGEEDCAGNVGHQRVSDSRARQCSCRRYGHIETLASSAAIVMDYVEYGGTLKPGGNPFAAVHDAALRGDELAIRSFESAGSWLGVGIANVMNVLNPRVITVGGGVIEASSSIDPATPGGPYLRAAINRANEEAFDGTGDVTTITKARCGNDGGVLGAVLLACRELPT